MKTRTIRTEKDLQKLSHDVLAWSGHLPVVVSVTQGTAIRSSAANARHWVLVEDMLEKINQAIETISEQTGYTPAEARKVVAAELPPEHVGIIYARTKKAIHDELKAIRNISTSTKLGTKEFSRFDDMLEGTAVQIIGEINAVVRKAM